GVAHDQDDVAERFAADPGRVVLEEAGFAVRAGEVELLAVVESADVGDDRPDGLGAVCDTVHRRTLDGGVVGQAVYPDRLVVGGRHADAVETSDQRGRSPLGGRLALRGHGEFLLVGNTTIYADAFSRAASAWALSQSANE